jgi:hypothetical protein
MTNSSSPPFCVQVLQGLAVLVIAPMRTWVALQQMYLARVKLQHDLYDSGTRCLKRCAAFWMRPFQREWSLRKF